MVAGGAAYDVVVVGSGDRGVAAPLRGARCGTDLYAPTGPYLAPAAGEAVVHSVPDATERVTGGGVPASTTIAP